MPTNEIQLDQPKPAKNGAASAAYAIAETLAAVNAAKAAPKQDNVPGNGCVASQPCFENLRKKVIQWAVDKGILPAENPLPQIKKCAEECNEMLMSATAFATLNRLEDFGGVYFDAVQDDLIDGIGDALVTIIVVCEAFDLDPAACLADAYDVISKRTGKMVNGMFVKDE